MPATTEASARASVFDGFTPLTANFVYCPNQFFDLVLPSFSRGVVRLVGYLLRRTLGWLDHDGNPVEEQIAIPYQELIDRAGISRGAIRSTLDEAINARLVQCSKQGRAHEPGRAGVAALYELRWDDSGHYVATADGFAGFFTGEGHRSPIPNAFFDVVIREQPLAVVQVVGAVLRHTVGYQNQFGGRRQQAPLSYSYLQRYTGIGGRRHMAAAIRTALDAQFIRCVREGVFDPNSATGSEAAEYAVKWSDPSVCSRPVDSEREPGTSGHTVQKGNRVDSSKREPDQAFREGTESRSKREPTGRSNKGTPEKTLSKDTSQRQQQSVVAVESMLVKEGFNAKVAATLGTRFDEEVIRNQLRWIAGRQPTRNRLGLLRRAIEENWPAPEPRDENTHASTFAAQYYAAIVGAGGESVAVPSHTDIVAASRFLKHAGRDPAASVDTLAVEFAQMVRARAATDPVARQSLVVALRRLGDLYWLERARRTLARDHETVVRAKRQQQSSLDQSVDVWVEERFARCSAAELATLHKAVLKDYAPLTRGLETADPRSHPRLSRLIRGVLSQQCPLRD